MSADSNALQQAPQPGLRSFIVYSDLPEGCFALAVDDGQTDPHLRHGEIAVVDGNDLIPVMGELFVCAFSTRYPDEKRLRIMEALNCDFHPGHFMLAAVQPQPLIPITGAPPVRYVRFADGPYPPEYLTENLFRGKVVGIYEPRSRLQGGSAS